MVKIAIVVGHTKNAPGAFAAEPIETSEYSWNGDLANKMVNHASTIGGAEAMIFRRDDGGIRGAYREAKDWGADAAIELHFNAAGPSATGSETLYVTPVSKPLAEAVQDATVMTLDSRDRGVKTPNEASGGRGTTNLSQMGAKPSILTEPFFGSNIGDCTAANANKARLAEAQIGAALNFLLNFEPEELSVVSASALNVRGGPGLDYERLSWGPLHRGESVEVVSRHDDWAFIETENGERGFVFAAFLT